MPFLGLLILGLSVQFVCRGKIQMRQGVRLPPSILLLPAAPWKAREAIKFMVRLSLTMSPSPLSLSAPPATIFIFTLWK